MQYEDEMLPIAGQTISKKSAFEMLQVLSYFPFFMSVCFSPLILLMFPYIFAFICLNQEERKNLPIYPYRDELLKAIEDHQVNFRFFCWIGY